MRGLGKGAGDGRMGAAIGWRRRAAYIMPGGLGMKSDMDTVNAHIRDLMGANYERSIRFRVRERARQAFALDDPIIALSMNDPLSRDLECAIDRARSGNRVSMRELESLIDTDIILSDEQNRYVAVEISLTADERDLTRARERADILGRVTGGESYALVAAQIVPDELREKAAAWNVAVTQIEYRG